MEPRVVREDACLSRLATSSERRMRTDDDRQIERIRARRGDRPHTRARCELRNEAALVAEAADVHGACVQSSPSGCAAGKLKWHFDLVRQVFQLAGESFEECRASATTRSPTLSTGKSAAAAGIAQNISIAGMATIIAAKRFGQVARGTTEKIAKDMMRMTFQRTCRAINSTTR